MLGSGNNDVVKPYIYDVVKPYVHIEIFENF